MAKASKLPSGNWRTQVTWTDNAGKKHKESFTASTKQESEMMALKFKNDIDHRRSDDITVKQAVENYIKSNTGILSPSTIHGYSKDSKRFESINNMRIRRITSLDMQMFISELVDRGLSAKTIKNTYSLLTASLAFCGVEQQFKVHLPSIHKKQSFAPSEEDIKTLYADAPRKMKIAIMLGCHSLRRGEIAALTYGDIYEDSILVHSDMVKSEDGKSWVHKKNPKTDASNRAVRLSQQELELLGQGKKDEYIIKLTPGSIGTNFYNLCKRHDIKMRFHDLRGYYASLAVAMNIPDIYASLSGGWRKNSSVLKEHYQKPIVSIYDEYAKKMNEHFDDMFG